MAFNDGHFYVDNSASFRVPTVFDNLIHQKRIPPLIGIFIEPGHSTDYSITDKPFRASERSNEYDVLSEQYVRFLIEEMIPAVGEQYNLTDDRKMRGICGISSGGICAFTAAWERPDYFHKVMSHVGSFTDIRGGHVYPKSVLYDSKNLGSMTEKSWSFH